MKKINTALPGRIIPATMATQHPDNAWAPYWEKSSDGFISTLEETEECYSAFKDLDCEEFMWDWEGKYVDEAVIDRLFHTYFDYFKKNELGKDKFLTFRIPNIWHERGYSLARAMMGILTAESFAKDLKFHTPPLFEVILPLTSKAEDIIYIQDTFSQLAVFKHKLFKDAPTGKSKTALTYLNVHPLFEGVDSLLHARTLIDKYVVLHNHRFKKNPDYLRLHIARSDPALNSSLVAAVVAGKIALSEFYKFSSETGIPVYPAIGAGLLPFRGSLSPERVKDFMQEYPGMRTVYIQSAFRYDFPLTLAQEAIHDLNVNLRKTEPKLFGRSDINDAEEITTMFSAPYRKTVEALADTLNDISQQVPSRRERKLHTGLFGYSRSIGKKRLPRAIPFTATLYTLGVPPEFIGAGRGLEAASRAGLNVEHFYRNIKQDMELAGAYLNRDNLDILSRKNAAWKEIQNDIALVEKHLGIQIGPSTREDNLHRNISSAAMKRYVAGKSVSQAIIESGKIRRSLG